MTARSAILGPWLLGGLTAAIAGPLAVGALQVLKDANVSRADRWVAEGLLATALLIFMAAAARMLRANPGWVLMSAILLFPFIALLEFGALYLLINIPTSGSSE
jgi:hypothetical protein